MGSNKARIDYMNLQTGVYITNIYGQQNPNQIKELGDVGNDIKVYGSRLYAVINCSHKVEVMDLQAHRIGQVDLPNCRYLAFADGKAYIKEPRDCWGCTSCVKECRAEAIDFFLGADIGGRGSTLTTKEDGDYRLWTVTAPDGNQTVVRINKKDANKY